MQLNLLLQAQLRKATEYAYSFIEKQTDTQTMAAASRPSTPTENNNSSLKDPGPGPGQEEGQRYVLELPSLDLTIDLGDWKDGHEKGHGENTTRCPIYNEPLNRNDNTSDSKTAGKRPEPLDGNDLLLETPPPTVLPILVPRTLEAVRVSVGNAGTNPGNTPSPSNNSQAAIDGVRVNGDASSRQNSLVSGFEWFRNMVVENGNRVAKIINSAFEYFAKLAELDAKIINEIIEKAASDYDLEYLKRGLTVDEFNQRIDEWKEMEHMVVNREFANPFRTLLDFGEDWEVFHALQLYVLCYEHRRRNGEFPPGYRTLFNSSKADILSRSRALPDWLTSP